MTKKRERGVFYTQRSPFKLPIVKRWAKQAGLIDTITLEPFAGANNIIYMLQEAKLCNAFASYDILPTHEDVKQRDTVKQFPKGYKACVTNPPWLARNSATRRGLPFPNTKYDDLYKHCIELCLQNCDYVGALIPATFLQSQLFTRRLSVYILLHDTIFDDTENPVCLALFNKRETDDTSIYYDTEKIGNLKSLKEYLPVPKNDKHVRFNDPNGQLGFISFDNTKEPTIKFCRADEIAQYDIKVSSRFITRISGHFDKNITKTVKRLNKSISMFRQETKDVFLTPFKGLRSDGQYRRRMDYALARRFINAY